MEYELLHDFILIKEVALENKIEGTNLNIKYDDNDYYMYAEIVQVSKELPLEYVKYYPDLRDESMASIKNIVESLYKPGNKVILQRIAKVPFKDGLYFASFKDVLAVIKDDNNVKEFVEDKIKFKQMSLFE